MDFLEITRNMNNDELFYFVKDLNNLNSINLLKETMSAEEIFNLFTNLTKLLVTKNSPLPNGHINLYSLITA